LPWEEVLRVSSAMAKARREKLMRSWASILMAVIFACCDEWFGVWRWERKEDGEDEGVARLCIAEYVRALRQILSLGA
jgi:hypothetical protein